MRRRTTALTLMLTVILIAGGVLLFVDFRLKERRLEDRLSSSTAALPQDDGRSPTSSNPDTPPPTVNASPSSSPSQRQKPPQVDGRIDPNEYAHVYYDAEIDLWLYWTIDEEAGVIYLGLKSPASGWVAIAFAPTGPRMKGGDILIGYVDENGEVFARDDYAHEVVSHTADTELGEGTDDILTKAGSRTPEGGTILEFVRPLTASDPYDKPIVPGRMRVQLAYSEVADFESYHTARALLEIDFFTGEVAASPPTPPP